MKRAVCLIVVAVALVFAGSVPSYAAWGHGGWHRGPGVSVYWGVGPWYPWYPWYPYPAYSEPPVIVQQSPTYVAPQQQQPYYWYYCQSPRGYYPYVKSCPGGWMKVVPNTVPRQ